MRAFVVALITIAAVMYWRVGFQLDSPLTKWILIGVGIYVIGRG